MSCTVPFQRTRKHPAQPHSLKHFITTLKTMKLHLPKALFAAVMAACVVPTTWALSITGVNLVDKTIDATQSYTGYNVTYTVGADKLGTISRLDTDKVNYTFTFDYTAAGTETNTALMYVTNNDATPCQWGIHLYRANGSDTTKIVGHWYASGDTDGMHGESTNTTDLSSITALTTSGDSQIATVTARIYKKNVTDFGGSGTKSGTFLYNGTDTTETPIYAHIGLFSGNSNIKTAVFNTNLVKTITVQEYENLQISAGEVSTVLSRENTTVFGGTGKHEVNIGDSRLNNSVDAGGGVVKKNIVVAGTSQLFLNTWNAAGDLEVLRDIYIGSTTFNEGGYTGAAIRFGNNDSDSVTNVNGTLYVMEDAIVAAYDADGSKAINIKGGVTDIINGTAANSTLTFKGKGYNISSDVSLGGMVVHSNAKVTFAGESSLTIGSTIDNKGTLVLNGTLAVRNDDLSGFDYQNVGNIEEVATNGLFDIGTKYILVKGNALDASSTTTTVSYNGQTYNIADGITTLSGRKGYAVVESDKTVTLGGSSATEGTADAATIYVHGGNLSIAEGTYSIGTSSESPNDITYSSGSMVLATGAKLQTVSGDISSIVKNSTGSGTLEIGNGVTNLIAGNDTYGYDGKISVKSGGQLNLNQQGNGGNSMNSISLANATIDMDGGRVRYFGGSATIGTINVNSGSTLEAFATWDGDNEGVVTINNLNVSQALTIEGQYESSITIKNLALNNTMTLNANSANSGAKSMVTIESLSGTGMLQLQQGNYTLAAGTHTIDRIDASKAGNNKGTLILAAGANLTVSGTMWLGLEEKTPGIKLGKGASLTRGEVKFIGSTDTESSISRVTDGNHGDTYGIGNASYVVKNAAVEVTSAENKTMYNRLQGVALSNIGTGKLTVGNSHNNLTELKALTGDIDLTWYNGQGNQSTISNLNIAAQRTVGAYTGDVGSAKATVEVSGLTAGAGATLNANLVLNNGATLTFDGALAMGGSTLTLGTGLTLNAETLAAIKRLSGDERYELFTGVGALTLGEKTYAMGTELDATSGIDLSKYFKLADAQTPAVLSDEQLSSGYYLGFDANGTLYAGLVPEPTTATLSLLALAALAARRRRK